MNRKNPLPALCRGFLCPGVLALLLLLGNLWAAALPVRAAARPVSVILEETGGWTQGAYVYTQYLLTLTGKSGKAVTSWKVRLNFNRKISLENSWNGSFTVKKKALTVRGVSYNKEIPKGSRVSVGFILRTKGISTCSSAKVTVKAGGKKTSFALKGKKLTPAAPTPTPSSVPTAAPGKISPTPEPAWGAKTPLSVHGRLRVKGTQLVDEAGEAVTLKGVSTHGLAWFPQYVNREAFQSLRDQWNVTCIRLALYTEEYGGYCSGGDQAGLKALIRQGVEAATDLGLYVILDWHILQDGNPQTHQKEALAFFQEMASAYRGHKNVIYEICNEPNGDANWTQVKRYAKAVYKAIRSKDKKNLILVGTPSWCQDVDVAAASPLTGVSNIMYTFHFYAATHKDTYRAKVQAALDAGLPVFVSEFGICDATGDGGLDLDEAAKWMTFLEKHKISHICWNLSNKAESSSLLKSTATRTGNFQTSDLSQAGKWYKKQK